MIFNEESKNQEKNKACIWRNFRDFVCSFFFQRQSFLLLLHRYWALLLRVGISKDAISTRSNIYQYQNISAITFFFFLFSYKYLASFQVFYSLKTNILLFRIQSLFKCVTTFGVTCHQKQHHVTETFKGIGGSVQNQVGVNSRVDILRLVIMWM